MSHLRTRFERWSRYGGPATWPTLSARSPAARLMHQWPELAFLEARSRLLDCDPTDYSALDHVRVRVELLTARSSDSLCEPIRNFDYYFEGDDLQSDARQFNDILFGNLERAMRGDRLPNPALTVRLRFFSPIPVSPEGARRTHLCSWQRPWL